MDDFLNRSRYATSILFQQIDGLRSPSLRFCASLQSFPPVSPWKGKKAIEGVSLLRCYSMGRYIVIINGQDLKRSCSQLQFEAIYSGRRHPGTNVCGRVLFFFDSTLARIPDPWSQIQRPEKRWWSLLSHRTLSKHKWLYGSMQKKDHILHIFAWLQKSSLLDWSHTWQLSDPSTRSCHHIWYWQRNQFCRKGCCTSCSPSLCWHTQWNLGQKGEASAILNVGMGVNCSYPCPCSMANELYKHNVAKVPTTSCSFPFKRSAMATKEYWTKMVALWAGNEYVQYSSTHMHLLYLIMLWATQWPTRTSHSFILSLQVPLALPRKLRPWGIAFRSRSLRSSGKRNCHGQGVDFLMLQIVHGYMSKELHE